MKFRVIDNKTGKEANVDEILDNEEWADSLIYCDIEGFALLESGSLVLLDECGNFEYCPSDRFTVVFDGKRKQSEGKWIKATPYSQEYCNQCGLTPKTIFGKLPPFCPNCGAKMKGSDNERS